MCLVKLAHGCFFWVSEHLKIFLVAQSHFMNVPLCLIDSVSFQTLS